MQLAKKYISLPLLPNARISINELTILNWGTYRGFLGKFPYSHLTKFSPHEFPPIEEDKQVAPLILHTPLSLYRPPYKDWEELRVLYDTTVILAHQGKYIFPREVNISEGWIRDLLKMK